MAYLSPELPRWLPTSESELESAARAGLLKETHYLDLKREVEPGKGPNKELARDLAQFAIDGGTLIIGLDEGGGATPALSPVSLNGLAERIEQVARSVPDPPLPVRTSVIHSSANPAQGYVLVEVPVSGTAPHMVDGIYFGRGDKTRTRLSDSEVLRLHHLRTRSEVAVEQLLNEYIARDPFEEKERQQAHLFVVAAPVAPRREMALRLLHDPGANTRLYDLVNRSPRVPNTGQVMSPDLSMAGSLQPRSDGVALAGGLTRQRTVQRDRGPYSVEDVLEIEFTENGAVRLLMTRLSDTPRALADQVMFEIALPLFGRCVVGIASEVADRIGYAGPWVFGVHADRIAGLSAHFGGSNFGEARLWPSDAPSFRETTLASTDEIAQTPGAVTQRLVGRFLRTLGLQNSPRYAAWVTDAAATQPTPGSA